jgi:hypothetical protein
MPQAAPYVATAMTDESGSPRRPIAQRSPRLSAHAPMPLDFDGRRAGPGGGTSTADDAPFEGLSFTN